MKLKPIGDSIDGRGVVNSFMKNEIVICISTRAWDSPWSESQKVMDIVRKQNKVYFFDPGRSVNRSLVREMIGNFANFFRIKVEEKLPNLIIVYSPPVIPFGIKQLPRVILKPWMHIVNHINNQIIAEHVQRVKRKFHIKNEILYIFSPYMHQLPEKTKPQVSCYHNYDEFSDFVKYQHIADIIWKFEKTLTKSVDFVFCTSRAQTEKRVLENPNTYYVPNGVNYELFKQALNPDIPIPQDLKQIPTPIIGYTGIMADHIDINLLVAIAKAFKHHSLVLVGPDRLPRSKDYYLLKSMKNVYFLGFKSMDKLPHYVKYFNVCLIPYIPKGHMLSAYPQKLLEYLSSGKPVVVTAMPMVQPYHDVIAIAHDDSEAIELIKKSLNETTTPELIEKRTQVALNNTWTNRVDVFYEHIQTKLFSKS